MDPYPHCQASAVFVTCSRRNLCCKQRMLQMRLWTGVRTFAAGCRDTCTLAQRQYIYRSCETDHSHHTRILHGGWLHRGPHKTTELSKLVGGHLHRNGHLFGAIWYNDFRWKFQEAMHVWLQQLLEITGCIE